MKLDLEQDTSIYRRGDYPDTGEQLDAIWKILSELVDRKKVDPEALSVLDSVFGVKSKFPKKK